MAEDQDQDGIIAYHGSPHEFDKFDISKIGTGEGAQAYGHGLYFAESEPIARDYRDRLTDVKSTYRVGNYDMPKWVLRKLEDSADRAEMIKNLKNNYNNTIQENLKEKETSSQPWLADQRISYAKDILAGLEHLEKGAEIPHTRGRMYEVKINAHPDHFLDWDKPLSEQPEVLSKIRNAGLIGMETPEQSVRNRVSEKVNKHGMDEGSALNDVHSEINKEMSSALDANDYALYDKLTDMDYAIRQWWDSGSIKKDTGGLDPQGSAFLHELEKKLQGETKIMGEKNPYAASEALKNAGIKGIKYLDASSRDKGEGSRNYVVFDHNDVDIKRRYEQGGAVDEYPLAENAEDHFKEMPPQEFLDQARPLKGTAEDKKIIQEFKKDIKKGEKLDPLALYKSGKENGRHRATAAKELGIKKVPVHDYRKRDGGAIVKHALMVISKKA